MPNVDRCVRECENAMVDDIDKHSKIIALLPNAERVNVFKNKSQIEIARILRNCRETIVRSIREQFYSVNTQVPSAEIILGKGSNNNKEGADVMHKLPSGKLVDIEVKFGQKTDKAIGTSTFSKIFGTDTFTKALSPETRNNWVKQFRAQGLDQDAQMIRLKDALNAAIEEFNNNMSAKDSLLNAHEQAYMENIVLNNSGDGKIKADYYLSFTIKGDNFEDVKKIPSGVGQWEVSSVDKLNGSIKRANIFITNKTTNLQIKFTLNWKNNYPSKKDYTLDPNKGKVSAKLGFGAPSWNVWVEPVKALS